MVSMLQSIKLQPPEEVTNAMETAEVMNVSVEWFPVQCTLRLTFFHRVLIYALMPIFAVLIPLMYVHIVSKCTPFFRDQLARKRRTQRTGKKIKGCAKCFYSVVGLLAGDDLVKKAASRSTEAGESEPWHAFRRPSVPNSARSESGKLFLASPESVGPRSARHAAIALGLCITRAMEGPSVMKSHNGPKKGLPSCSA